MFHHIGKDWGPAISGAPGGSIRLDQVNTMSREEFTETFGPLFQGPTWPVERAYDRRPFSSTHDLREAFQESLLAASAQEQHDLMEAYPDLGAHLVADGDVGEASLVDQSSVGLTQLDEGERDEFDQLTTAYREKFDIPLIMCVRNLEKRQQIVRSGWRRMENAAVQEHMSALNKISEIANHRFDDRVAEANPIASARIRRFDQLN